MFHCYYTHSFPRLHRNRINFRNILHTSWVQITFYDVKILFRGFLSFVEVNHTSATADVTSKYIEFSSARTSLWFPRLPICLFEIWISLMYSASCCSIKRRKKSGRKMKNWNQHASSSPVIDHVVQVCCRNFCCLES